MGAKVGIEAAPMPGGGRRQAGDASSRGWQRRWWRCWACSSSCTSSGTSSSPSCSTSRCCASRSGSGPGSSASPAARPSTGCRWSRSAATCACWARIRASRSAASIARGRCRKPLWQRYAIVIAGPAFNLLLPMIIYFVHYTGQRTLLPPTIGTVLPGSAGRRGRPLARRSGRDRRRQAASATGRIWRA